LQGEITQDRHWIAGSGTGSSQGSLFGVPVSAAVILSRMGVDLKFQKKRVGEQLLLDAIFQVARMKLEKLTNIPVVGLVIDAKDDGIKSFYQKYGFTVMDEKIDPFRLWLPAATCAEIYIKATS